MKRKHEKQPILTADEFWLRVEPGALVKPLWSASFAEVET